MNALLMIAIAGVIATLLAAVWRAGFQAGLATAPECVPAPESALLSASEVRVEAYRVRAEFLERIEIVPADPISLPWQQVPTRAEVTTMQALADEVMTLRGELNEMRDLLEQTHARWVHTDRVRARHWGTVKRLRIQLAAMVPVAELEAVEDLRTRSLSVARSAASRAADRAAVITEVEAARFEAQSLEDFNEQFELILAEHGIEVGANA